MQLLDTVGQRYYDHTGSMGLYKTRDESWTKTGKVFCMCFSGKIRATTMAHRVGGTDTGGTPREGRAYSESGNEQGERP